MRRVALEVLDGRREWWVASECKRLEEREFALRISLLGKESLDGAPRLRHERRGAGLDQEQQDLGASGGHAAENLLTRQQVVS
ncbi:MAG: hypothetical protein LC797_14170 [Chloroflexi bacterium]|nr:hypothetical protein [Chloroflexota bacterium]